jgi:hypothetical protein
MKNITGLNYSDSDMTLGQIDNFINQVKQINRINCDVVVENLYVTGGEPLLHKDIEEIMVKLQELQELKLVTNIFINSNKVIAAPISIEKYIVNFSLPSENKDIHSTVLLHPSEFSESEQTYSECTHYRKNRVVLNYLGYSICCAVDAYIRLFNFDDLILESLPASRLRFPLKEMNKICKHCPFGHVTDVPLEKNVGCPVSQIYSIEAHKNRLGRVILKRFPEA